MKHTLRISKGILIGLLLFGGQPAWAQGLTAVQSMPNADRTSSAGAITSRTTPVDQTISGRVTDGTTGAGLPGVSVVVKGTNRGTTTDGEGNYRVSVLDGGNGPVTLAFSFIGYVTQEVAVGSRSVVNVTLATDDKTLSEIVVVGYGTQNRR